MGRAMKMQVISFVVVIVKNLIRAFAMFVVLAFFCVACTPKSKKLTRARMPHFSLCKVNSKIPGGKPKHNSIEGKEFITTGILRRGPLAHTDTLIYGIGCDSSDHFILSRSSVPDKLRSKIIDRLWSGVGWKRGIPGMPSAIYGIRITAQGYIVYSKQSLQRTFVATSVIGYKIIKKKPDQK